MFKLFLKRLDKRPIRCPFCDRGKDVVEKLISNSPERPVRAYICDECVAVCQQILEEEKNAKRPATPQ